MHRSPDLSQVGDVNSSSAARIAATLQPGAWAPLCPVAGLFKPKGGGKPLVVSPGASAMDMEIFGRPWLDGLNFIQFLSAIGRLAKDGDLEM
jgi:hypothetical protein